MILFGRNVESPEQVLELTRSIKRRAARSVFVSIDQEGGRVSRLRAGFSVLPAMRVVGRLADETLAGQVGTLLGRELSAVGVDVNFAPVVDVDTNPENPVIGERAFGSDPNLVARLGGAFVRGQQRAGVAACAKHFPGHGDTQHDSHLMLPRLSHDWERLQRVELVPFRKAVREGVAAIMTAHVVFEPLDEDYPATLSTRVLEPLLRRELAFEGVVFSDDMEMKAIADRFPIGEAAVRAVEAGVDQLLVCHTADTAHEMISAVARAVERGELSLARLERAAQRVRVFAETWARAAMESCDLSVLACSEHRALIDRLERAADKMNSAGDPSGTGVVG